MLKVSSGQKSKFFKGLVLDKIPVRDRAGKLVSTWVMGICSDFEFKNDVKEFCAAYGGGWESSERYWFVPLNGSSVKAVMASLWEAIVAVRAEIPHCLPEVIEVSIEADLKQHLQMCIEWLVKQDRKTALTIVQPVAKVIPLHIPQSDLPQEALFLSKSEMAKDEEEYQEARAKAWQGEY